MIKAGILTPNFSTGGAERWVATLLKYADPKVLQWTGICVSGWGSLDPDMCGDARRAGVPIFSEPRIEKTIPSGLPTPVARSPDCEHYLTRLPTIKEAVKQACQGADILMAWGSPKYVNFLDQPDVPKTFVYCSHSSHHRPEEITDTPWASVHLTAVSERAKQPITRPGNPPITVIYNGVDAERLWPTQHREVIRAAWGVSPETKVIAYVGRFSAEKNPMAAISAMEHLSRTDWHVVHYGDSGMTGNLLERATQRARPLPAAFFPATPDVGNVYAGADAIMLASNHEAFSLVMIEAWLSRKPVIATPVGAVPELKARFGDLVIEVPKDPSGAILAAACKRAVSPEGDEIVTRAYEVAREHFTADAMLQRWIAYFNQIQGVS